jgi:diguanylate cyclase (GGDEF)-like protein/PAS domain S-box-containing protein
MIKRRLKPLRALPRPRRRLALHRSRPHEENGPQTPAARPDTLPAADSTPAAAYEWKAAFDDLSEPVFIHDREFRILRCNPAYAALAGQPIQAIIGKPYWQVFPKLPGPLANCVEALHQNSTAQRSELTAANGQVFLSHDITARLPSGDFWYSRHLMENMTARGIEENALKLKFLIADAALVGMPGFTMVLDRRNRLVRWNGGLEAFTGRNAAQLLGADAASLFADTDRERMARKLEEAFSSGRAEGEIQLIDSRGAIDTCVFAARSFHAAGESYLAFQCFGSSVASRLEGELAVEKAFADTIIESAPGPYYVVDQQARLVRWNKHLHELTGLKDEQLRGASILGTIFEEDRQLAAAKFLAALAMGYAQMEVRMPTTARGLRTFLKTARRFEIGGVPFVAGFCIDVTERTDAENALAKEKAFMDALVNSVPGAFYVVDGEGNYFTWNSYLNRLTGLSNEELRRRSHLLTIEEKDRPLAAATMKQAFENGYAQAELHVLTHDRGVRLYFMAARRFQVGDAAYLVGVGVDNTERGARIQELEKEVRTDPLTHVANRSHFLSLAAQEFARSRRYGHPLSLWMIDVDHFKAVNDTHGHHAGDIALQSLSTMSRQTLRDWDVMGRMGGEEFAVLLPDTDATQALLVAERLRQKVASAEVGLDQGASAHLTVSIGVATIRDEDRSVETLIDRADQALLDAKRTGRDKVCVAEALAKA